jgi:hypothetical protein
MQGDGLSYRRKNSDIKWLFSHVNNLFTNNLHVGLIAKIFEWLSLKCHSQSQVK